MLLRLSHNTITGLFPDGSLNNANGDDKAMVEDTGVPCSGMQLIQL